MLKIETPRFGVGLAVCAAMLFVAATAVAWFAWPRNSVRPALNYQPRQNIDTGGFSKITSAIRWNPAGSLSEIGAAWRNPGFQLVQTLDGFLSAPPGPSKVQALLTRA